MAGHRQKGGTRGAGGEEKTGVGIFFCVDLRGGDGWSSGGGNKNQVA